MVQSCRPLDGSPAVLAANNSEILSVWISIDPKFWPRLEQSLAAELGFGLPASVPVCAPSRP
jgi:hypothetical protein